MGELVEKFEFHEKTKTHTWVVKGEKGAVHVWAVLKDGDEYCDPRDRLFGGTGKVPCRDPNHGSGVCS